MEEALDSHHAYEEVLEWEEEGRANAGGHEVKDGEGGPSDWDLEGGVWVVE